MRWIEKSDANKQAQASNFPPSTFMDTTGAQCPDYWILTNQNTSPNAHQCNNKFKLPIVKSTSNTCKDVKCYDDEKAQTKSFPTITTWSAITGRKDITEQCKWRDCCRISTNPANPSPSGSPFSIQSSWIGLEDKCGV